MITDILQILSDGPKSDSDYNLKNQYGNDAIRCIASIEEMFDVINDAHQKTGGEEKHLKNYRINGLTPYRKLSICLSRFVKNAIRESEKASKKPSC
ncbi:hypothetical protein T02_4789 [Trichinella nativa]|uniref:Uncharacterized protein n=1 Tax=Trichinella nativa TaxID=6335 RepID=A0A0V1KN18_9BILA|nr:hypothetical protein T02_9618 [Trichinella nativa]KRZ48465.1 hypothetical protein T02_11711 [Trichinella nativa]KRZ49015.1 hypothetical protein T02_4789 [Trichinella nativa]